MPLQSTNFAFSVFPVLGSGKPAVQAGASKYDSPRERRHNLRRTKTKERRGETGQAAAEGRRPGSPGRSGDGKTRDELYREARRRDIPGRSKMNKQQLERALHD